MSCHKEGDKIEWDETGIKFIMAVGEGELLEDFNEVKTTWKTCGVLKQLKKLDAEKIDQGNTSVIKILYNRKSHIVGIALNSASIVK